MTIQQLEKKLKEIPAKGEINKGRRREIIAAILKLAGEKE